MAIKLEKMPRIIPVRSWIGNKVQKFWKKKSWRLKLGKKISSFGPKPQQIKKKVKTVIKVAKKPEIIPWIKKGARMNQLEAPTNLIMEISSRWLKMANLIVLKATKKEMVIKIILIPIPALLITEVIEDNLSIIGFLW